MTDMLTARVRRDFLHSCESIRHGSLILTTPEGTRHEFGTGEPVAELVLHDWAAITATALEGRSGVVLVIEDLTELLAAQRASAWREKA